MFPGGAYIFLFARSPRKMSPPCKCSHTPLFPIHVRNIKDRGDARSSVYTNDVA